MISQIMILSHIIIIWYWKAQLWSRLNWPTLRSTRDELHLTSVYHVFISSCIHIMSWCLDIVNSAYLSIWTHGWRGWRLPGFSDELVCYTWKYFINIVICKHDLLHLQIRYHCHLLLIWSPSRDLLVSLSLQFWWITPGATCCEILPSQPVGKPIIYWWWWWCSWWWCWWWWWRWWWCWWWCWW